jgi:hypothetical protein
LRQRLPAALDPVTLAVSLRELVLVLELSCLPTLDTRAKMR